MSSLRLRPAAAVVALFTVLLFAAAALTVSGASGARGRADSGTVWIGATHQANGLSIFAGDISDRILGRGAIVYEVTASAGPQVGTVKITAKSVTLYTSRGSLRGTGYATQTTATDGSSTVTDGHVRLTRGTGAMKGHSLVATFSGPLQDGVYTFAYKGTYR